MIDYKKEYISELEEISQDIDSLISKVESLEIEKATRDNSEELSYRIVTLIAAYKDLDLLLEDVEREILNKEN
jgi:hypothetical protein